MPTILLRLPQIEDTYDSRPRECPYCGGQMLQKWGRSTRNVHLTNDHVTQLQRYRCGDCSGTFREYPGIMSRSSQSNRIRRIAAIAWSIGMSLREVVAKFESSGVELSHTTVWREGKKLAKQIDRLVAESPSQRYVIDINFVPRYSNNLGVVLAVDIGERRPIVLGTVNEHNPRMVKKWLEPLTRDSNIEVSILGTDLFLNRLENHYKSIAQVPTQ